MMKSVILLCLCGVLIVAAAPKLNKGHKYRVTRQSPSDPAQQPTETMNDDPKNAKMSQPDTVPAPDKEVSQKTSGASNPPRNRRQAPNPTPTPPESV